MITTAQLRYLHVLLNKTKLAGQKAALVSSFSNEHTESAKELLFEEASALLRYLEGQLPSSDKTSSANQMRRKIISTFHKMQWEKPDGKIDIERVNEWCRTKSYLKKELQAYTSEELPKLVSQAYLFYKYFLNQVC